MGDIEYTEYDREIEVATAMIAYGGGFVCMLGKAFFYADPINKQKIIDAFPEYWEKYSKLAYQSRIRDHI